MKSLSLLFVGAALAPLSFAQVEEIELAPVPDVVDARFGRQVALEGLDLVVSALRADSTADEAGTVLHFKESSQGSGWTLFNQLIPTGAETPEAGDHYGASLAMSGGYVAVGAPYEDGTGAVHLWHTNGQYWGKLTASDAAQGDRFGWSVALDLPYLLVGAPLDDDGGSNSGSVYAYYWDGSTISPLNKPAPPSSHDAGDLFGWSLALEEVPGAAYAVIGARGRDDAGPSSGAAFQYFRTPTTNWVEIAAFFPDDPAADQDFGWSVDLSAADDLVYVGAPGDAEFGTDAGAAYVFHFAGGAWGQERKLTAPDTEPGDLFGYALVAREDELVVGSPHEGSAAFEGGALYTFGRIASNWILLHQAWDPNASETAAFGISLAATADRLAVGSSGDDTLGLNAGAAATFAMLPAYAPVFEQQLLFDNEACGDNFGAVVDVSGKLAAVGSWSDGTGSVTVFDGSSGAWLPETKLRTSSTEPFPAYGAAVALSGERLVVGATNEDEGGVAYFYSRSGGSWTEDARLTASNILQFDGFGTSVDVDGDYAIVGAHFADGAAVDSGAAYVFHHDGVGWSEVARLDASDGSSGDSFGWMVAIRGELAAVGKPWPTTTPPAVYVYRGNGSTWTEEAKLTATSQFPTLGQYLAVDGGDTVVFGDTSTDAQSGAVHVWVWDGNAWTSEAELTPSDGFVGDQFGLTLDVQGDLLVASSFGDPVVFSGAAYLFQRTGTTWSEEAKWVPEGLDTSAGFGRALSLDDGWVLGGATFQGAPCYGGRAYLGSFPFGLGESYCGPAVDNSTGAPAEMMASGSDDVVDNDLTLTAVQLPPNKFGYFLASMTQGFVQNPGGSQGNLCLGGTIGRFAQQVQDSGSAGEFSIPVDLTDLPPPLDAVLPGDTWNFQAWFRDKNPDLTSNFTDGLSIAFD